MNQNYIEMPSHRKNKVSKYEELVRNEDREMGISSAGVTTLKRWVVLINFKNPHIQ